MWNISKTRGRRAKLTTFGTQGTTGHICRAPFMSDCLSLRTLLTQVECRLLLFLAFGQDLQNLWYFDILTLGVNGKT